MTDNSYAKNLINKRGRRCVATILTYLEENVWMYLSKDEQQAVRGHVLSTVGEFQDLAMDMVTSDTGAINDFWVEELEKVHQSIRELSRGPIHAPN